MRASGWKGWPFLMPIAAKRPTVSGSTKSAGSFCTAWFSSLKNSKALPLIVLNCLPDVLTKVVVVGLPKSARR